MHLLLLVTLSPVGRATGPPCRRVPARDLFENKKFYRKVPVANCLGDRCLSPPRWATEGYFCNLLKQPYIFEILFFKKYKKEKSPGPGLVPGIVPPPENGGKMRESGGNLFPFPAATSHHSHT